MSKIEIKSLHLIFGKDKNKALKKLQEGKNKAERVVLLPSTMRISPYMKVKYLSSWVYRAAANPPYFDA